MKNRIALILAGVMLGAVLSEPVASATEQIVAQRSTQRIYVDGRQTAMEAYSINGSNFVRLRDVGKIVGFSVSYREQTQPYQALLLKARQNHQVWKMHTVCQEKFIIIVL